MVPEDCVGDHEEGPHRDNLRDTVTSADVLAYFEDLRKRNR
jgi:hypothetical protein